MKSRLSLLLEKKRNEKGLTKRQTAEIMGVTPMYYARFENNNLTPTKRNIKFFADFLEINQEDLLKLIEEDKNVKS